MRLFTVLVFASLVCIPSFAQDVEVEPDPDFSRKSQYAVEFTLFAGDKITQETAVTFFEGYPASMITYTKRGTEGVPGVEVVENLRVLILAGTTGCQFTKPEAFTDQLWDGFWLSAQHLVIGELDFYVYSPMSDRIAISVDLIPRVQQETGTVLDILGLADLEKVSRNRLLTEIEFYGSLEMPYHCNEIGTPRYMYMLTGFHGGKLVGETQLSFIGGNGARSTMLCRAAEESEGVERGVASCLLVVVDKDTEGTALADIIIDALDGYKMTPLNTVTLGQFAFYYYYPKYDEAEFTLWELEGEYSEDWQSSARFLGHTRVANNQPEPTAS